MCQCTKSQPRQWLNLLPLAAGRDPRLTPARPRLGGGGDFQVEQVLTTQLLFVLTIPEFSCLAPLEMLLIT
jgi:hypothetical protein